MWIWANEVNNREAQNIASDSQSKPFNRKPVPVPFEEAFELKSVTMIMTLCMTFEIYNLCDIESDTEEQTMFEMVPTDPINKFGFRLTIVPNSALL